MWEEDNSDHSTKSLVDLYKRENFHTTNNNMKKYFFIQKICFSSKLKISQERDNLPKKIH